MEKNKESTYIKKKGKNTMIKRNLLEIEIQDLSLIFSPDLNLTRLTSHQENFHSDITMVLKTIIHTQEKRKKKENLT